MAKVASCYLTGQAPFDTSEFHYVYVLRSPLDGDFYVGMTGDLRERLNRHNDGQVLSTRARGPFTLVYYEACRNIQDAARREKYLKTACGKRFIKSRLANYLTG